MRRRTGCRAEEGACGRVAFDDVLAAAQAGAAWAFEVLYRDLSPAVTGYLRLHGAAEPDDLASETFLGVFTGLAGLLGGRGALRSWVFTIAHRRLVDDWRRRSRRPQVTDDAGDLALRPGGDAEDDALMRAGTARVHRMCAGPARRPALRAAPAGARRPHGGAGRVGHGAVGRLGEGAPAARAADLRDRLEGEAVGKNFWRRVPLGARPAMTGVR